jgi:hypothetical protein
MSLCLIKHNTINTYGGLETELRAFLASTLDGGEWSVSRHGRFTSGGIKTQVNPKAFMVAVERRKISHACRGSNPHSCAIQAVS